MADETAHYAEKVGDTQHFENIISTENIMLGFTYFWIATYSYFLGYRHLIS